MVGDGADTLFWHDLWLGGVSFRVRFSRLFELAVGKSCTVSYMSSYGWDVGGRVGGGEGNCGFGRRTCLGSVSFYFVMFLCSLM